MVTPISQRETANNKTMQRSRVSRFFLKWLSHSSRPADGQRSATDMTAIACDDRRKLRDAVIAYMNGTISTYAFDDLNCECMDSRDKSIRQVSKLLYQIHDDTVDHPISVTRQTWDALIRIVAFLDTDLYAGQNMDDDVWPFNDDTQWNAHRSKVGAINIPSYDSTIHALQVHGPLNRIPTLVGLGIILAATTLLIVFLSITTR